MALPKAEDAAAVSMFRMIIGQARSLIRDRNRIEQIAQALLADHQDYQLLCKIPGIGPINVLTILAEAGDLRRFRHHRQFLKFCGLDHATSQSGTFRGRTRLSKYGNAAFAELSDGPPGRVLQRDKVTIAFQRGQ